MAFGGDGYGYSYASQEMRRGLERLGVEMTEGAERTFRHFTAEDYEAAPGKFNVLGTAWEANRMPRAFVEGCLRADRVVVPCGYNKLVLEQEVWRAGYGVRLDVRVVPHGYDAGAYPFVEREAGRPFRFLWVGAPNIRKGWDLAVRAFGEEFRPWEPVELVLKTSSIGDVTGYLRAFGRVVWVCERYTMEQMRDLYESCHAFVFPSRGEGWGLPALEAMGSGLLVIAPSHTGLAEFVSERTALVPSVEWLEGEYGVPVRVPTVRVRSLRRLMRLAYERYEEYRPMMRAAAAWVRGCFTWNHAALLLRDAIFED